MGFFMDNIKQKNILYFILYFLVLNHLILFGLDPEKPIHQNIQTVWTSNQGLPSDNITSVLQDNKGYIWIGTFNGLVKFEGIKFKVFSHNSQNGFKSNSATVIFEDSKKTLWIGTNGNGLAAYKKNEFTMFTMENGLVSNYINTISEDDSGNIWIGTRKGLNLLNESWKISTLDYLEIKNESINIAYKDQNGKMLIAAGKSGLFEVFENRLKQTKYSKFLKNFEILSILDDKNGKIWIGTKNNGLFIYNDGKLKSYPVLDNINVKTVNTIKYGNKKSVWICTDSGIFRFYNNNFSAYTEKSGLSNNQVVDFYEDLEGNAWIATSRGGLIKLSESKFYSISKKHGLIHNTTNVIMNDKDGNYWIGTDKGLSLYRNSSFLDHPLTKKMSNIRVRHIIQDSSDKIWVCTYSKLGIVSFADGKIKSYSTENGLSSNRCRFVLEDKDGKIWVGTSNGLNTIVNNRIINYTKKDGLNDNYILSLFRDSRENIWITTNGGGVNLFKNDNFISYSTKDGLASDVVFSVFEDSRSTLWFATNNGLSRYKNNKFLNYSVEDGLFGNAVFQILEDRKGKFWMTADIGIFTAELVDMEHFAERKLNKIKMKLYDNLDGLPGASTPVSWGIHNKNGEIWFPTLNGVANLNTLALISNQFKPPVFIEEILVDNRKYSPDNSLILKPDYKRITINFAALSFVVPDKVKFKYILEGFDDDWSDISTERHASYTILPPGNYNFRVIAVNNDGLWNKDGISFKIIQKPYFYQTIWFNLLLILIFFFIVFAVFIFRIRNLRKNKLKLETLVQQRTKEISIQKNEIIQKNSELEIQQKQLAESKLNLEQANKILNKLSVTDSLTGLSNRRKFDEFLYKEWGRNTRRKSPISLLMIDVDYFKYYNDEYGHHAGDMCLKSVAEALINSLHRSSDLIARYGGEEFAAVLPDSDMRSAFVVAERIREEIKKKNIKHEKSSVDSILTVSIGVATEIPLVDYEYIELLKRADEALYRAKTEGRNRVSF